MATCKEIDSASDQITKLCNLCESNVSDGYCDECEDFMCRSCFDLHSKARTCKHHVLLDDLCETGNKKSFSEPCKRHPNQSIKYYCIGHKIVGCVECFFTEHRNCEHQSIEDAAKKFKDGGEDTRLKREIQRLESTHSEYTDHCEQERETAAVINNAVVNGVKSFKDKVTSYVATMEERVLEKAEGLRLENETRLEKRVTELDSVGEELELCIVKLENQDNAEKLFVEALDIKPKVENLGRRMTSLRCQTVVTKYEFQPNKLLMEMIQESRSFGEVCVLPGDDKTGSQEVDQVSSKNNCPSKTSIHRLPLEKKLFMTPEGIKVMVYKDSIIRLDVDCIANAANSRLQNGGGVALAISEAAGDKFERECQQFIQTHKELPVGEVCSTTAGNLNYKCVIHTVGPAWSDYDKTSKGLKECEDDLMHAVLNSFYEAEKRGMKSIALPAISSAIFGVPITVCVKQYVRAVQGYSKRCNLTSALSEIHFIDSNEDTVETIQCAFGNMLADGYPDVNSSKSEELPEPLMVESRSHLNRYELYFMDNKDHNVLLLWNIDLEHIDNTASVLVPVDQIGNFGIVGRNIEGKVKYPRFQQEKKELFKSNQTVGSVLKIPGYGCGFMFVLYAIYPFNEKRKTKTGREKSLTNTVANVLNCVAKDPKIQSVAIPMFGIDSRKHSEVEMFMSVFLETYRQFCQEMIKQQQCSPLKVIVVCHEYAVYNEAQRVLQSYIQHLKLRYDH